MIHEYPAPCHPAALEFVDDNAFDPCAPIGCGNAPERGRLRPRPVETCHDGVALHDPLVDVPAVVRKSGIERGQGLSESFTSRLLTWRRVEFDVIVRDQIVDRIQLMAIEHLVEELLARLNRSSGHCSLLSVGLL